MNESTVPVTALGGVILLLACSKRIRSKMASLVSWLFGSIAGAPTEAHPDENSEPAAASSKGTTTGSKQSKKREARQRPPKRNEAPKFSTSLSGPIEEALNEEISDNPSTVPTPAPGQKSKKKTSKKAKPLKTSDKEKFVFVKQKSCKHQNTQKVEPQDHTSQSLVTAKKDSKFLQGNKAPEGTLSAVIAHGTKKKKDAVKPSIIDHYKPTERASVTAQESNKDPDWKISKTEYKESKKVCSDISYASIVTNTAPISFEATSSTSRQISKADENSSSLEASSEADSERSNEADTILKRSESFDDFVHIDEDNSSEQIEEIKERILSCGSETSKSCLNEHYYTPTGYSLFNAQLQDELANIIHTTVEISNSRNQSTEELPESPFFELDNSSSELSQIAPDLEYQTYEKEARPTESEQKNNLISLSKYLDQGNSNEPQDFDAVVHEPAHEKSIIYSSEHDQLLTEETVPGQNWNLEASINIDDQIQNLEDQIIDEPYVVEETEVVLASRIKSSPEKVSEQPNVVALEEQICKDSVVDDIILFNEPSEAQWSKTSEYYIEEQIQSLEDQIIPEPYTVEESETVVTFNTSASHRAVEDLSEIPNAEDLSDLIDTAIQNPQPAEDLVMAPVNILVLNEKANWESRVHRIQKNVKLEFRLGPSLLGRNIKLYCNYPKATNGIVEEFNRDTYTLIKWSQNERYKNADGSSTLAQITPTIAGSFHYYFNEEQASIEDRQGSGYFIVDPVLKYGANEVLPLDCIQCQTVLAKHLGAFPTWENKLRVAKESGYNMVHFTPIQELGASNSSYSVREHLKLNGTFSTEDGREPSFEDIEALAAKMREEWKMLSVCDIVLNHTANESDWIKEHPEATYNCVNCPYMRPAYLLDAAFHQFSMDVKKGLYEDRGIPAEVSTEDHLNAIRHHFKLNVLEPLKIPELFTVDENKYLEEFLTLARKTAPLKDCEKESLSELEIIQDPQFRRLQSSVDLNLALKKYNSYRLDCFDEESRVRKCAEDLKVKLDALNEAMTKEVTADLSTAVENVIAGIRYFRVQQDGPLYRDITIDHPLVYRYFTDYGAPKSLVECEETMYGANGRFLMAHNGWVMNSDPLKNFADSGTKVYIRRELIAWGDSVKLRFGDKPADSPFLWNYMRQYVEQTVKIFDGIRLDNCHSTPLPVAEYLLDCARKIRPDLYVVAELFTNSDLTDNIFVNRLGITSLIREAMSAWDSHEQGRLVYRYGGVPVGAFYKPAEVPLAPMVAHALFLDLTHDNPSPVEKRSVFDLLPSTALVNMACCATGSNRGYDELVPHHIHVVDETRQYAEWSDDEVLPSETNRYVNKQSGIIAAKRALNALHFKLGVEGFDQVFVNQVDSDIVEVTRHQLGTHTSYVLVAFTSFVHPGGDYQRAIKPLTVEGVLDEIVLEASLSHTDSTSKFAKFGKFSKDSNWINGLTEYRLSIKEHIQLAESDFFEPTDSGGSNFVKLNYKSFKPGSVAVLKFSLSQEMQDAVSQLKVAQTPQLSAIISDLTLADLNRALFRCGEEERDEGKGFDAYNIPNFGPTVYCGLAGITWLMRQIAIDNDLGHPLCANLRNGNWLIEYVWKRLKVDEGTLALGQWIEEYTRPIYSIPRYLVPCYFDLAIGQIYRQLLAQSYQLMSDFINEGSPFVQSLALGSLQFAGYIRSANLPELSPNLAPPKPPSRTNETGETVQACVTLSAGLPHFAVGYMRNWGRDTFIALRGLLILTGRFEEARQHILGYAACLRHGLIPNLLDGGKNPRFNCRDAIWWWIYSIKAYCEEAPNGSAILSDVVSRIFPLDNSNPEPAGAVDQPLHDIIQESLNVHFQGLKFGERNAGRQIDEHMTDAGFNNQIGIHPETGFVFGGNQWNCGTWMDKMGSSDKASNRGKPATPRDGSAVELVGLSKASITWLWRLNDAGQYPYDGVQRTHKNGTVTKWTFREWAERIQHNFEKNFWISPKPSPDECRPDLVNKKNIYKDSFGASQPWTDYQLRCNFPIAMVAAPELFNPQHAWAALEQAEKYLLGPLGMKTLDPEDWNYRGDYDNSNDSDDFLTSHGFNYHQGPEWVWPVGFFLRARLMFAAQNGLLKETVANTKKILSKHFNEVDTPPWRGLPELTNRNGSYCKDSSRTQAWSMSCILEVLYDLEQIESKKGLSN